MIEKSGELTRKDLLIIVGHKIDINYCVYFLRGRGTD